MFKKDTIKFSKEVIRFLKDKPSGKYQTLAHIWDRLTLTFAGLTLTITAFSTNNAGMLLLIVWSFIIMIFGIYLVSRNR